MGKVAFVFAGQGAQTVGMGSDLREQSPAAKKIFDFAENEIIELIDNGPQDELNLTINAQPAVFLMDLACARALNEKGVRADGAAGFSLGEVAAAAYCGIMTDILAYDFVKTRAAAMHECAAENPGGMAAALKLTNDEVEKICAVITGAYPVNYNCAGQIVVAYVENAADKVKEAVTNMGGRFMPLAVSGPFHSPMMDGAKLKAADYLAKIELAQPAVPLYANATAELYDASPAELLSKQIASPVLWQKTVENMIRDGFDTFIEVGPGKVLSGLIKKINVNVKTLSWEDVTSGDGR